MRLFKTIALALLKGRLVIGQDSYLAREFAKGNLSRRFHWDFEEFTAVGYYRCAFEYKWYYLDIETVSPKSKK